MAAALPHPVIDLSPEKLADPDYMLGQFYIVDDNTEAGAAHLNAPDFLEEDFYISKRHPDSPDPNLSQPFPGNVCRFQRRGRRGHYCRGGKLSGADPYRRLRISGGHM